MQAADEIRVLPRIGDEDWHGITRLGRCSALARRLQTALVLAKARLLHGRRPDRSSGSMRCAMACHAKKMAALREPLAAAISIRPLSALAHGKVTCYRPSASHMS
ncbi:hypothetical protein [Accumulibacter sp.]|uniref:hypothetical protein n=1 Tax=Accumulibacter sp. TaxID=2053492 RepID=UPI00261EF7DE|nr:hypothetical protein [Accumulibacter sp.]